jgi:hypothetical protein
VDARHSEQSEESRNPWTNPPSSMLCGVKVRGRLVLWWGSGGIGVGFTKNY